MFVALRTYHSILLLVLCAAGLAGCGADSPTAVPPTSVPPPAQTALLATATAVLAPPAGAATPTLAGSTAAPPTAAPPTPPAAPATPPPASTGTTPPVLPPAPPTTPAPPAAAAPTVPALPTEAALTPEQNPPGDISDSQVFVTYQAADGSYQLEVPEGWGRTVSGAGVAFVDKLDGVQVTLTAAPSAPTVAGARAAQVPALERNGRAVRVATVRDVTLPGGSAVLIEYASNSDPNAVTGKQVRLENAAYLFFHNGRLATLHLWAPAGADNVDQWQRMAQSFRWR